MAEQGCRQVRGCILFVTGVKRQPSDTAKCGVQQSLIIHRTNYNLQACSVKCIDLRRIGD